MTKPEWRERWRWLFGLVALSALAWTVWLLWDSLPALRANLSQVEVWWLLLPLFGGCLYGYFTFEAFRALFECLRPRVYGRLRLGHLFFTGQLMKHLPGRIWGVAYQSVAGGHALLVEWVAVSIMFMALTTCFALWIAATVLVLKSGWYWSLLVLMVGAAMYALGWRTWSLTAFSRLLKKMSIPALRGLSDALECFAIVDPKSKLCVGGWFLAGWLIYFLAWSGYGIAWPGLAATDGIWLCAIYTLAWFVGYVSLLSPSGIGVRELVFVLLAQHFPPDAVAGMAVLGRVVLMLADVLLGAAFMPFRRDRGDSLHGSD